MKHHHGYNGKEPKPAEPFQKHKALITVPRQRTFSVYKAAFTVILVTYYAPGCFRVDQKLGEFRDELDAIRYIKSVSLVA